MALSKNQVSSRWVRKACRLRTGLAALTVFVNVFGSAAIGLQVNTTVASAATVARPAQNAPAQAEVQSKPATIDQVFLDPTTCLLSNWAPFSNTTYVVPQGTVSTQVVVSVTSLVALDATTSQFTAYTPGGGNSAWATAGYTQLSDFTVIMTASNILVAPPTNGALPSVQFKVSRKNKGQNDVDACSPVHTIFAATKKLYLPLIFRSGGDNQRDITTIEEPNNTTCAAYPIALNVKYTARLNDKDDFFRINVPVTSTLVVTVTGFTSNGQVQVRKFTGACDTGINYAANSFQGDPLATRQVTVLNVVPGEFFIRVASTADLAPNTDYGVIFSLLGAITSTGPYEPNNNACQAYPIAAGTTYQAYPEDTSDWYSFTLSSDANVTLNLTNLNVTVGQYILYKASSCSSVPGSLSPITVQDKSVIAKDVGVQSAGTYFLRVAVGSGTQSSSLYSLRVNVGGGNVGWSPKADICSAIANCNANRSGGKFTVYWAGIPGMTEFKISFNGKGAGGTCPTTTGGRTVNVPPSSFGTSGSYEITDTPKGYWGVQLSAKGSGGSWSRNGDLPLKMDCDFLSANAPEFLPEPEPTVIPEVEITPVP
jgi:hypothetical protein